MVFGVVLLVNVLFYGCSIGMLVRVVKWCMLLIGGGLMSVFVMSRCWCIDSCVGGLL